MRNFRITFLIVGCLFVFGIYALARIPKQEFPEYTIRQGVVVGVYLNASLMRTIGDTADHLYRERFLAERYGYIDEAGEDSSGAVSNAVADEISADIAYYVELAKKESPQL